MIALLRSTDGNPDSRFEKYVDYLTRINKPFITLCWDRKGNKTETSNAYYYKRPSTYGKRYGNIGGLFGFNSFLFKTLWKNRSRYTVIHACDFDTVIPAILIHILLRKKVIYDIFDWYVDSRNVKGILKWAIYAQEFLNIKMSEVVIICEEERRKQIIFKPKKLWILPNIPNFKNQQPVMPKNGKLTIGYVGILASGRGLENLINYAKENRNINLKIGGFGTLETMLLDVDKYSNITYYGSVPYVKALEILNSVDIVYAMYQKINKNHILAAPNKYYEGLYLGKPIITTAGTIVGDKTTKYNTGFVIEESYEDLTRLLSTINGNEVERFGQNAKALWNEKYSTYVEDFFNNTYRPFVENKGFLFIANSTKPTLEKSNSLTPYTIGTFGYAPVKAADEMGYKIFFGLNRNTAEQVECTNFDIQFYNAHIYRDVFAFKDNWIAYKNLVKLLKEHPEIGVIHCNTPIGGVLGRICGHKFNKTVIYTAHGFHFYKGAPLKNWLLYYPIEKFLARWTDALITINAEDFEAAKKFKYKKGGNAYYIPGVGVELEKYTIDDAVRQKVRKDLNISDDDIAVISMGDLVERKNYMPAIEAIAKTRNPHIHYFICGDGVERTNLENLTNELYVKGQVHFLGFRRDVFQLLTAADIFMLSSQQEGLPRSTMEAMVFGLPCVLSNIRGNIDLVSDGEGGFLCEANNANQYADALNKLAQSAELRVKMGKKNRHNIENLSLDNINAQMRTIYDQILAGRV